MIFFCYMKVAVSELQAKNEILQQQTMSLKEEHSLQKHKFEELCKVHVRLLSTICIPKNLPYTIWLKYIYLGGNIIWQFGIW